jgi:hypothetical protein
MEAKYRNKSCGKLEQEGITEMAEWISYERDLCDLLGRKNEKESYKIGRIGRQRKREREKDVFDGRDIGFVWDVCCMIQLWLSREELETCPVSCSDF